MKVKTISYGFTFNKSNYQSERIDMTAELGEGEDEQVAIMRLKAAVLGIGGDTAGAAQLRRAVALLELEEAAPGPCDCDECTAARATAG